MSRYFKILISPAILMMVLIGLFIWRGNTIGSLDNQIADRKGKFQEMLALLNDTPVMMASYASMDSVIRSFNNDLFGLDEAIPMVRTIGYKAADFNVVLQDFKFDINKYINMKRMARASGSYFVPFEARFKGNYIDIGKYTAALEIRKYIGSLNYLQITHDPVENTEFYSIKGFVRFYERIKGMAEDGK